MVSKKIIITRPEYDDVTGYLSNWALDVILSAQNQGLNVIDLGCENVTRACKIFLLLDEGYNLSQISQAISSGKKGDGRKTVKHWIKKYEKIGLIKQSSLSKSRLPMVYEKDYEREMLIKVINYICLKNLKSQATKDIKKSLGTSILERKDI